MTRVGEPMDRVDAPAKVTGGAPYPSDADYPDMAHAALVRATIAAGRISRIDTAAAERAPGVLAVLTHLNAPRLREGPRAYGIIRQPPLTLQDDRVWHHGQYVAAVVAETPHQARAAADLIEIRYAADEPLLDPADPRARTTTSRMSMKRGNLDTGFTGADVIVEAEYTTAANTHNPIGLFATTALWDGDHLTVHDTTQGPAGVRAALAGIFEVPAENVHVRAPYIGGAFGAGIRVWPHVVLAAVASRVVRRPVKLVLTRPQMFTGIGHRPATEQRMRVGATSDGRLVAIDHRSHLRAPLSEPYVEPIGIGTAAAYACPNLDARDTQTRLNIPSPTQMRAPGEAQGNFALESALDELAEKLRIDPVELRVRNHADVHPHTGMPWSSRALKDCYLAGAERFGWAARDPRPRSTRDGHLLIGSGMAGAAFPKMQFRCAASAAIDADGTARIGSSAMDLGTGTYTVMTRLAAELLGLPVHRVRVELGDTDLPKGLAAGGSATTASLGAAVEAACVQLVAALLRLAAEDPDSPLHGCALRDVKVCDGRIHRTADKAAGESFQAILDCNGLPSLSVEATSRPPAGDLAHLAGNLAVTRFRGAARAALRATRSCMPAGACAAHFVEVHVDADLGQIRVARVVTAVDGGRILNARTARSQITGGVVGGLGMALMEETVTDPRTGRVANATLADYLVPVNADVPDIDVTFVGDPDPENPLGVKGIGEIGLVGVAAAVANAVYHATGIRARRLPIPPGLLTASPSS